MKSQILLVGIVQFCNKAFYNTSSSVLSILFLKPNSLWHVQVKFGLPLVKQLSEKEKSLYDIWPTLHSHWTSYAQ